MLASSISPDGRFGDIQAASNYLDALRARLGVGPICEDAADISGEARRKNRRAPVVGARVRLSFGPCDGRTFDVTAEAATRTAARRAARMDLASQVYAAFGTALFQRQHASERELARSPATVDAVLPDTMHDAMAAVFDRLNADPLVFGLRSDSIALRKRARAAVPYAASAASLSGSEPTASMRNTTLPISKLAPRILQTIATHDITILSAATGSGKTTQVPQFLADAHRASVLVTQPRRVAAITVADRVSKERAAAHRSTAAGTSVGYAVRFDSRPPRHMHSVPGTILYATVGVVLRRLQNDPDLCGLSHIVLDEVHERDVGTDMLLMLLRALLARRLAQGASPPPKLVLMSATMGNPERLAAYFEERGLRVGTVLDVEGTHHAVAQSTLGDVTAMLPRGVLSALSPKTREYVASELGSAGEGAPSENTDGTERLPDVPVDLAAALVAHIAQHGEDGAILAFLPGWEEIRAVHELLMSNPAVMRLSPAPCFFLLHSSLPPGASDAAFVRASPGSGRKIVLATNIAESSVTIPDAVHVVDAGRQRIMRYDARHRMNILECAWVSRANVRQRLGRAGRCQPGHYYALYGARRAEITGCTVASSAVPSLAADGTFLEQTAPEVMRLGLEDVCLSAVAAVCGGSSGHAPAGILSELPDPPPHAAVASAIDVLLRLGAVKADVDGEPQDDMSPAQQDPLLDAPGTLSHSVPLVLTPLGRVLASLPLHPALGRMIITAAILGCLDPILTAVSATGQRLFLTTHDQDTRDARSEVLRNAWCASLHSDHALIHRLVQHFDSTVAHTEGNDPPSQLLEFVSPHALRRVGDTRRNILRALRESGVLSGDAVDNRNADNDGLVRMVLACGLYPNIAVRHKHEPRTGRPRPVFRLGTIGRAIAMSGSAARTAVLPVRCASQSSSSRTVPAFYTYEELLELSGQRFVARTTAVDPVSLVLAATSAKLAADGRHMLLDGLVLLRAPESKPKGLHALSELRLHWNAGLQFLLHRSLLRPAHTHAQAGAAAPYLQSEQTLQRSWLQRDFGLTSAELDAADALLDTVVRLASCTDIFRTSL